jgi:hypothetical protein
VEILVNKPTLDSVIETLKTTIRNKAALRAEMEIIAAMQPRAVESVVAQFLDINLTELSNILEHLEEVKRQL